MLFRGTERGVEAGVEEAPEESIPGAVLLAGRGVRRTTGAGVSFGGGGATGVAEVWAARRWVAKRWDAGNWTAKGWAAKGCGRATASPKRRASPSKKKDGSFGREIKAGRGSQLVLSTCPVDCTGFDPGATVA